MSPHKNEHDDLKGPHKWTRESGYQPVEAEENEAASETSPAGASDLSGDPAKYAEAVEYVKSRGYNEDAAKAIVEREGVNMILQSKADQVAEQLRLAAEPVMQPQVQAPAGEVDSPVAAEKEEDDIASA